MARQHLPVQRTAEVLLDLYGVRVSTGWLGEILPRAEAMLAGFATAVADQLAAAPVAHFDETGAYDPTDAVGRLLFNVLAMVAESDLIRLRTREE